MNYLDQLDKMFDAQYRLITIETYDPQRVEELIGQLSRFSNKAYYLSKPGHGLTRIGAAHIEIPRTKLPSELLTHILEARHFGIYILSDFHPALEQQTIVNQLHEIINDEVNKVVVMIGEHITLPESLKPYTMRSKHKVKATA